MLPLSAADLFDILLPMLNIYQEFVRNHQYSLQILAHCKQNRDFDKLLKHYEAKPDCEERTLETFLTYPMFQVTVADSPPCPSPAPALCCAAEPLSALFADPQVHPDAARAAGAHPARARGEEQPGLRQVQAGGALQVRAVG